MDVEALAQALARDVRETRNQCGNQHLSHCENLFCWSEVVEPLDTIARMDGMLRSADAVVLLYRCSERTTNYVVTVKSTLAYRGFFALLHRIQSQWHAHSPSSKILRYPGLFPSHWRYRITDSAPF